MSRRSRYCQSDLISSYLGKPNKIPVIAMDKLAFYFDANNFMPHGHCFLWVPAILWLHVISDILIALAYYSIPTTLHYFVARRRDLPFKSLFCLYGAFILLCGTTHLLSIWVIWHPDYSVEGIVKAVTALVSVGTAIVSWRLIPKALELKSPAELERVNLELRRAYETTEQTVMERTAELTSVNARLQKSEADLLVALTVAQEASAAKSEFLANMSHEIRTPMNAVMGISSILGSSTPLTERQKEFIKTLQLSADALLSLINDLLDIAKIESHSIDLEAIPFHIRTLLDEVLSMMRVPAETKGLALTSSFDHDLGNRPFIGDPARLRQIILNLCSNAVKFTEAGSINIDVSCKKDPKENGREILNVSVRDTGIGIPPDKINSIFAKFVQADSSINRKYGGTGLGLAIAKTLAELMDGDIKAESVAGQGSTFTLSIPLKRGNADAGAAHLADKSR